MCLRLRIRHPGPLLLGASFNDFCNWINRVTSLTSWRKLTSTWRIKIISNNQVDMTHCDTSLIRPCKWLTCTRSSSTQAEIPPSHLHQSIIGWMTSATDMMPVNHQQSIYVSKRWKRWNHLLWQQDQPTAFVQHGESPTLVRKQLFVFVWSRLFSNCRLEATKTKSLLDYSLSDVNIRNQWSCNIAQCYSLITWLIIQNFNFPLIRPAQLWPNKLSSVLGLTIVNNSV